MKRISFFLFLFLLADSGGYARPSTPMVPSHPVTANVGGKPTSTTAVVHPVTVVKEAKPTTLSPVNHPVTPVVGGKAISTHTAVFHPTTTQPVFHPVTQTQVVHPTTTVVVSHPTTILTSSTEGNATQPGSGKGGNSKVASTNVGGSPLPPAKDFTQGKAFSFTPNVGGLAQTPDVSFSNSAIDALKSTNEKFSASDSPEELKRKAMQGVKVDGLGENVRGQMPGGQPPEQK